MADWLARNWKRIALGVITLIIIPVVLSATGLMDMRLPFARSHTGQLGSSTDTKAPESTAPGMSRASSPSRVALSSGPVRVVWSGYGDMIEATWQPMHLPGLTWYSVDVYGLTPVDVWYNVGYRIGDELRTSATTDPIAAVNEKIADDNGSGRVDVGETWKVCVTGMRTVPAGAYVSKYVIVGSKRCSDFFVIPAPR